MIDDIIKVIKLILLILVTSLIIIFTCIEPNINIDIRNDINKLKKYNGWIVTDKIEDKFLMREPFVRNHIILRNDSTDVFGFFCDDIVFEQLSIGDTIIVNIEK